MKNSLWMSQSNKALFMLSLSAKNKRIRIGATRNQMPPIELDLIDRTLMSNNLFNQRPIDHIKHLNPSSESTRGAQLLANSHRNDRISMFKRPPAFLTTQQPHFTGLIGTTTNKPLVRLIHGQTCHGLLMSLKYPSTSTVVY